MQRRASATATLDRKISKVTVPIPFDENNTALYLVTKLEPERYKTIKGNAIVLDNHNQACFILDGILVENDKHTKGKSEPVVVTVDVERKTIGEVHLAGAHDPGAITSVQCKFLPEGHPKCIARNDIIKKARNALGTCGGVYSMNWDLADGDRKAALDMFCKVTQYRTNAGTLKEEFKGDLDSYINALKIASLCRTGLASKDNQITNEALDAMCGALKGHGFFNMDPQSMRSADLALVASDNPQTLLARVMRAGVTARHLHLWSGVGTWTGKYEAKRGEGMSLELSFAGALFTVPHSFGAPYNHNTPDAPSNTLWAKLSEYYITTARGPITISLEHGFHPRSVCASLEYPIVVRLFKEGIVGPVTFNVFGAPGTEPTVVVVDSLERLQRILDGLDPEIRWLDPAKLDQAEYRSVGSALGNASHDALQKLLSESDMRRTISDKKYINLEKLAAAQSPPVRRSSGSFRSPVLFQAAESGGALLSPQTPKNVSTKVPTGSSPTSAASTMSPSSSS